MSSLILGPLFWHRVALMETLSFAASFCEDASAVRVDKVDCVFEEVHLEPSRIVGSLTVEHSFASPRPFPLHCRATPS